MLLTESYLREIVKLESGSNSTEQSYRPYLHNLLSSMLVQLGGKGVEVRHEPKRIKGAGAPDFEVLVNSSRVGFIETKDLNKDLDKSIGSDQISRYLSVVDNLILTNYLRFILLRPNNNIGVEAILDIELPARQEVIGLTDLKNKTNDLINLLNEFLSYKPKPVGTPAELASSLAKKTRYVSSCLLEELNKKTPNEEIESVFRVFKDCLYKDLSKRDFCDSFAQTLTYSIFLAKLKCKDGVELDLYNVYQNIPKNFPLTRELSDFLKRLDSDDLKKARWVIKEILRSVNGVNISDIAESLSYRDKDGYMAKEDPYIHFYETFLSTYDRGLRVSRGVYYTPGPVVDFITNSVDHLLKKYFKKRMGDDNVTLLDFATGTGAFLLGAIKKALSYIDPGSTEIEELKRNILDNFYGFELLIAPYTLTHLKLSELLREYDIGLKDNERLKVYLTNTLLEKTEKEKVFYEHRPTIEREAKEAQEIREKKVLVIIGNPPYNRSSLNKYSLIADYYYCGIDSKGNKVKLKETAGSLQDDYVKFIRFAQNKIDKQSRGIVGIISNNGFINNVTFRGMRWSLLNSFDEIYILDLHGNSRKKEKSPDGSKDENVFKIMAGVCISLFVKVKKKEGLSNTPECKVYHYDLHGDKESKYGFLNKNNLELIKFKVLTPRAPGYLFVPLDHCLEEEYEKGYRLNEVFSVYSSTIMTGRDNMAVHKTRQSLEDMLHNFCNMQEHEIREKYQIEKDKAGWKLKDAIKSVKNNRSNLDEYIKKIHYRPFDFRWTYYNGEKGFIASTAHATLKHIICTKTPMSNSDNLEAESTTNTNVILIFKRGLDSLGAGQGFVSNTLTDARTWSRPGMNGADYIAPLYLLEETLDAVVKKVENLKPEFRNFVDAKYGKNITAEDIFNYMYAMLYHKEYREKYFEFLKIDFPRVPFVDSRDTFIKLGNLGEELIKIHLMDTNYLNLIPKFKGYRVEKDNKDNRATNSKYYEETQILYINENLFFKDVTKEIWEYKIGGYQVLDKYLKSHKGEEISISHFGEIIKVLSRTIELEDEIQRISIF